MSVPQAIRDALRAVAGRVTGSARRNIQAWVGERSMIARFFECRSTAKLE